MKTEKKYEIGNIYLCKIVSISKKWFEVLTTNHDKGVAYINEISDYFVNDINSLVNVGDILYLTLINIKEDGILNFSFKENRSNFLRAPFKFEISENNQKQEEFQNLFEFTNKEIKKWKKLK